MTRIVVHIDKLVLRGVDRADAGAVSAGVHSELQRLLAEPGTAEALRQGGDRVRIRSGAVKVAAGGNARSMSQAIAGGIAKGARS